MEKIVIVEEVFKSEMTKAYKEKAMQILNLDITKRVFSSKMEKKEMEAYKVIVDNSIKSFSLWWDGNVEKLKDTK